jgi:hypothetical protein|tara:strand:- start:510 stop:734 length:225 start_codon:yes stop_codon:yes gene_type:complete
MKKLTLGMGIGEEGPVFELCVKKEIGDEQMVVPLSYLFMHVRNITEVQEAMNTINRFTDPMNEDWKSIGESNER